MPDLSDIFRALIGPIVVTGMYLGMRRRRTGWASAAREMPELAARLRLVHVRPATGRAIGKVRGQFDGLEVFVDPDEDARVIVRFAEPVPIDLRSYERRRVAPRGMERFDPARPAIDALFKERYAAPGLAQVLYDDLAGLEKAFAPMGDRWGGHLKDIAVTEEAVTCVFDYGKPPYIPVEVVGDALSAMVALAHLLTRAARRAKVSEERVPPAADPWHGPQAP